MKILSITLSDVRRFTSPVTIGGLESGVNVLAAPNESGKSTLFDALQAVFFQSHRSRAKEAKSLQPHAGGRPTVSVEIELPSGRYRITKRWLAGAMAEVREGSRLVAKDDAAEDWISAQLMSGYAGGPAGLLWVRQGVTALDGDDRKSAEPARTARRDLLSSVAGEVEAMTGGRRMERALSQCNAELSALVTNTGRAKAGGPLKTAEDEVAELQGREAELEDLSRALAAAIEERRKLRREAEELRDPETAAQAEDSLEAARAARDAARRHADLLSQAREKVETAQRSVEHAAERRDALDGLQKTRDAAARQLANAQSSESDAGKDVASRDAALAEAEAAVTAARDALKAADRQLARVIAAEATARDRERRARLDTQIETAERHVDAIAKASAEARKGPDAATIAALDLALRDLRVQEALRDQAALTVTMRYASPEAPRVRLAEGPALDEATPHPLPEGGALDFEGIGQLTIAPGARASQARDHDDAVATYERALAAAGAETLEEARKLAAARKSAEDQLREARAALGGVAPDGIEALKAERTALGAQESEATANVPDLPDRETAERAVATTRTAVEDAAAKADALSKAAQDAKIARAKALAQTEAAQDRLRDAEGALAGVDMETETTARAEAATRAEAALAEATEKSSRLAAEAPDLATAEAGFKRAQSALDAT